MLKVAGWIISDSAVDDWRRAHPELEQKHTGFGATTNAIGILEERIHAGAKPLLVSEKEFICTSWPKVENSHFLTAVRPLNNDSPKGDENSTRQNSMHLGPKI